MKFLFSVLIVLTLGSCLLHSGLARAEIVFSQRGFDRGSTTPQDLRNFGLTYDEFKNEANKILDKAESMFDCNGDKRMADLIKNLRDPNNTACRVNIIYENDINWNGMSFHGKTSDILWNSKTETYDAYNSGTGSQSAYSQVYTETADRGSFLIHELAHAAHVCEEGFESAVINSNPSAGTYEIRDDLFATEIENIWRRNNGCLIRTHYAEFPLPETSRQDCSWEKSCPKEFSGNGICIGAKSAWDFYNRALTTVRGRYPSPSCFDKRIYPPSPGSCRRNPSASGQTCYEKKDAIGSDADPHYYYACGCGKALCLIQGDQDQYDLECRDVMGDVDNCGACNHKCVPGQNCKEGQCVDPLNECG